MNGFLKFFLLVSIMLTISRFCFDKYYGYNLKIINRSGSIIYIQETCGSYIDCNRQMKIKISYKINGKVKSEYPHYRIETDSTGYLGSTHFHEIKCPDKKIYLFIFTEKTIENNEWNEICLKEMYDSKITLSQKQLDSLNWQITINSFH
jgi:hypothetical protein